MPNHRTGDKQQIERTLVTAQRGKIEKEKAKTGGTSTGKKKKEWPGGRRGYASGIPSAEDLK